MNRKLPKRELIEPNKGDKRYVRRIAKGQPGAGQFAESDDLKRSLSADDRRKAKNVAKPGEGRSRRRAPEAPQAQLTIVNSQPAQ